MFCWPCIIVSVSLQPCHSQLTLYARSIPNAVCVAHPEDEQLMLETRIGPWFPINWMKSAPHCFHYTDTHRTSDVGEITNNKWYSATSCCWIFECNTVELHRKCMMLNICSNCMLSRVVSKWLLEVALQTYTSHIIIIIITFMQHVYDYVLETNHISRMYSVAARICGYNLSHT
jgi:hypothetical protein